MFLADYLSLKYACKYGEDIDTATILRIPNVATARDKTLLTQYLM